MHHENHFDDIRPYYDEEINPALKRITAVPEFRKILGFLFPDKDQDQIIQKLENINSALEFQKQFMHPLVNSIITKTSDGLSVSGFDELPANKPYLFVANHRDIVLDSAILQVILLDYGHETSEITFGSNLMINQFIIDLGKVNRMFKVYRGGNKMEFFRNSKLLSSYIRHTITEKKTSAWIAQRNGRTKDGSDKTETGLLKMFNISGPCDFYESFRELNIVPLAISYEYEPCCAVKVKENLSVIKGIQYKKEANEDFLSIISGITKPKGRIHLASCGEINDLLCTIELDLSLNDKITKLSNGIDSLIYKNYHLWPANYIALDMLNKNNEHEKRYTKKEFDEFTDYLLKELSVFEKEDYEIARDLFLKIYANPVINSFNS